MRTAAASSRARRVVVKISGDEAGGDAERAKGLHHQHGEIATGAGSGRNGLGRCLRAFRVPRLVAEFSFDRVGHRFENCERSSLIRGANALCWVHAERLIHKLVPANDKQRNAIAVARRTVWWLYRQLKDYKLAANPKRAAELSARFDRIFKRRTGYATLDRLLRRLLRRKDELLRVLERPDIPLNTNASENDIRAFVTKRKISGGTVSERGRQTRDAMLGLAKTCKKLKIPFFDYLGARLGIPGPAVPNLATLVTPAQT